MLQKVGVDAWLRAHGKTVRPELTKKQKQELKECFDLIDTDGSGKFLTYIHCYLMTQTRLPWKVSWLDEAFVSRYGSIHVHERIKPSWTYFIVFDADASDKFLFSLLKYMCNMMYLLCLHPWTTQMVHVKCK